MRQAPIILADGDLAVNARSFAQCIWSENLTPNTEEAYPQATARLADYLREKRTPQDMADIKREHWKPVEEFIEDRLAHRLRIISSIHRSTYDQKAGFERIRPHLTPLECGIMVGGIPEGAISKKVGLTWGIPVYCSPVVKV